MQSWSRRRIGSGLLVVAGLGIVVLARTGWDPWVAPVWAATSLVSMGLAGMALSTYLPGAGQGARLEAGCGSCTLAGGLMALAAIWLLASEALSTGNALLGLALAGAALAHRLTQPTSCAPVASTSRPDDWRHPDEHRPGALTAVSGIPEVGADGTGAGDRRA
ncbi:MAG: hypothetical protein L0H79_18185 [Intrasporangium sp.]|uniref:hypothetical protein n=1 Tax=Intrasporangium sp. TaxID=1925024 RepID=UPI0026491897|nr:hypothetical protein [Intrasporangium sp.]MDN5797656.1 hypothetical protein [Intrasporangium sp.]